MRQINRYSAIGWAVRVSVTVRSSVRYGEWELELELELKPELWSEEYFVGWGKPQIGTHGSLIVIKV